jgi:hypothetical protein
MSPQLTIALMLAVTLGAALYVAWPLLFGRARPEEYLGLEGSEPVLQRLYFQRDTTYSAMKELDFDLEMGNLSQSDHQRLQDRYKRKAVAILKRIDDAKSGKLVHGELDDEEFESKAPVSQQARKARDAEPRVDLDIEQEIEAFRRKARESGGRNAGMINCPSCGRPVKDPEAEFCAKCGTSLRRAAGSQRKKTGKSREDRNG